MSLDRIVGSVAVDHECRHPGCGRVFETRQGRSMHERMVHGEVYGESLARFLCPYCGDGFESELRYQGHLEDRHGVHSKTLDWVERRTFENLVYIYSDELHKIRSESVVGGVLEEREKSRLLREGVLVIEEHGRMGKPTIYRLSEDALDALRRLDLEALEKGDSV